MSSKNTSTPTERPFNLTENEVNFTLHACKLLIQQDGKVDKESLAAATGKDKPETAKRMWSQIKNKMGLTAGSLATAGNGPVSLTPTKLATKRKSETPGKKEGNKRVKKESLDQVGGVAGEDTEMNEEGTSGYV